MKFTKLFAVTAVATSLAGGAIAEPMTKAEVLALGDKGFGDTYRKLMVQSSGDGDADTLSKINLILGPAYTTSKIIGAKFDKTFDDKCIKNAGNPLGMFSNLAEAKSCLLKFEGKATQEPSDFNNFLTARINAVCSRWACSEVSGSKYYVRDACGLTACNLDGMKAGQPGGIVYNCLGKNKITDGCTGYMNK